jgi:hypothetical protein
MIVSSKSSLPQRGFTLQRDGQDISDELNQLAVVFGLERAAPGRYSMLLLLHLFGGFKSGRINPHKVVREINALEGIGPPSRLKAPIQNRHPPLKGLWHKHYLQGDRRSLAINIGKGLKKYGIPFFKQQMKEAAAANETRFVSDEDIEAIAHDVTHENYARLGDEQAISGEWLLFAEHDGAKYYLALTTHDANHADIRAHIDMICCLEFPFLRNLLTTNA